jgi:hypothetical protein
MGSSKIVRKKVYDYPHAEKLNAMDLEPSLAPTQGQGVVMSI